MIRSIVLWKMLSSGEHRDNNKKKKGHVNASVIEVWWGVFGKEKLDYT